MKMINGAPLIWLRHCNQMRQHARRVRTSTGKRYRIGWPDGGSTEFSAFDGWYRSRCGRAWLLHV